nr:zinc ABC transporter permease AztB [Rhodococcus sp. (in: high G+C Gram-positive bacteria)]
MDWLLDPFAVSFVQRALWAGMLVSILCALVGTWVVLRGMAFLSDAVSHGMLPGVALAYLMSANLLIGAAVSAVVMIGGVAWVSRNSKLSEDTGIGLLFVGMLALGVVIVSRARSFAVDLTSFLFGDVLSATYSDLVFLGVAAVVALVVSVIAYRPFVALVFDERKAQTYGFRPRLAHLVLLALVVLAVVASFRIVGTLLVFGLLVAPSATAYLFGRSIAGSMVIATLLGWSAVLAGLLVSWHANTAAGATIAGLAVLQFFVVAGAKSARDSMVRRGWVGRFGRRFRPNDALAHSE